MPAYEWIFFDLDGTLWNFAENSENTLRILFDRYRLGVFFKSFDEFHDLYVSRNDYLWTLYAAGKMRRADLEKDRFEYPFLQKSLNLPMVAEAVRKDYLPLLARQTLLENGAEQILDRLKRSGCRLYIASNGFREVQRSKLENSGIAAFFDGIFLSEEIGANKPDRKFFDYMIKESGAERKRSLVVGDNFATDITGAMESGIDQAYYNPGAHSCVDFAPTYIIGSLYELDGIVLR